MATVTLVGLDKHSASTMEELATRDPALLAQVRPLVQARVVEEIDQALIGASAALRGALAEALWRGGPVAGADAVIAALGPNAPTALLEEAETYRPLLQELAPRVNVLKTGKLGENPALADAWETTRVVRLGELAGLATAKIAHLTGAAPRVGAIDDDLLSDLVGRKALTDADARTLGRVATLHNILDGDAALVKATLAELGNAPPREAAGFDAARWRTLIGSARAVPPGGVTADAYAATLARRLASQFPTRALMGRLLPPDLGGQVGRLSAMTKEERARFANRYPGLGIEALVGDETLPEAQKQAQVNGRLALLRRFEQQNPDLELVELDYSPDSADTARLNLDGISADERRMVLSAVKAYQRSYALVRDPEAAQQLLEAGYTSSAAIMADGYTTFAARTSLADSAAGEAYASAKREVTGVAARMGTIVDAVRGGFDSLAVQNLDPDVTDYLKKLDGFAALFGSQAACACQHCQSILSPAAYFVDLMCFADRHVTAVYFKGSHATHPLNLKVRRPDLWSLELTCANTDDLVPTLDIVNEILENYVAKDHGYTGSLSDRDAVEEAVYHQALTGAIHSLRQPFNLPLLRLGTYLGYFSQKRAGVADTLGAPATVRHQAHLGISRRQRELIITPDLTLPFLRRVYGIDFQLEVSGEIDRRQAKRIYGAMDLTRDELGALLGTRFVRVGAPKVEIRTEKKDADSVQNDIERVYHLTPDGLDRMHRLTRLRRCLPWSIGELDLVLTQLGDTALARVGPVVDLLAIQQQLGGSVEELCALTGLIPTLPAEAGGTGLFDRLFNLPFYVSAGKTFPQNNTRFVHPSFRTAPASVSDTTLARLLGALRVTDEDLIRLISALATPLGVDVQAADENARGFLLTVQNLSILYRHARLAERLALSVPELFQLIALAGLGPQVKDASDVTAALAFHAWWKTTSYGLDDLAFVTGGPVAVPEVYPDPAELADEIVTGVATDKALTFADTVFAYFKGVTEAQSRAVIAANPTLFELAPDGLSYWLASAFTPASSISIPPEVPVTTPQLLDLLLQHHAVRIIPSRLASRLSTAVDRMDSLLAMTGVDLTTGFTRVLQGADPQNLLTAVIERILPLSVLFRDPAFDAAALGFVRAQAPRFGIVDFASITRDSVSKLAIYSAFSRAAGAVFTGAAVPLDPADVRAVLAAFDPAQKFAGADAAQLARVLRAEVGLVSTVVAAVTLPDTAPEALDKLLGCVTLAQELGVSGELLSLAVSNDYDELQRAADAVLSAFRARFDDETEWRTKLEPFDDIIRGGKRDALVDYLVRTLSPGFADGDAIYRYFLIDVELGGCARTSRVVSAISTVQLYIDRVLMNLEQDDLAPSDTAHVAVPSTAIPADEWTWRKNYRVWEANRKVFLYPESYIEPELRDDKTPVFEDLESDLMQQNIDDQTVLDAYGTYLRGFDDVAKLTIAGVWHDINEELREDVLHVIGVAPGDPPAYYYRTAENLYYGERHGDKGVVWSPWRPIKAQITSNRAAPVVYRGRLYLFWCAYKTRSVNIVEEGGSEFDGYQHTMSIKFIMLRLDGTWTPAQEMEMPSVSTGFPFGPSAGQIRDEFEIGHYPGKGKPKYGLQAFHREPRDDYTLHGDNWDTLRFDTEFHTYPDQLVLVGRDYRLCATVNLYHRTLDTFSPYNDRYDLGVSRILCARADDGPTGSVRRIYAGHPGHWGPTRTAYVDLVLDDKRIWRHRQYPGGMPQGSEPWYGTRLADIDGMSLLSVSGTGRSIKDAILQAHGDVLFLAGSVRTGNHWLLRRIGTTLSDKLGEKLSTDGVDGMLATSYQVRLKERALPLTLTSSRVEDGSNVGKLDFTGPYGVYYREIFFHIPFLIANYLNSQGQYSSAQQWYSYIFDPTAAEETKPERDRNWRYREFRHLARPKLIDILTDEAALDVYRKDPFNPHAIARLRLSAYQKCIVMKYVDNLLDWGDSLFSEFTTESVNEATLLYVMAKDILGPRPEQLGDCGEGSVTPKTFAMLAPMCKETSEILIEIETYQLGSRFRKRAAATGPAYVLAAPDERDERVGARPPPERPALSDARDIEAEDESSPGIFRGTWKRASSGAEKGRNAKAQVKRMQRNPVLAGVDAAPSFGYAVAHQLSAAFCIPPNEDLLAYWDRVDDRLLKIRSCMDITGVKRQLALFAPEIDPRLLVRMKAAGLSLDDILSATTGDLPPYRFLFLIEKAKQYAATLQGYGAALLGALEKKDGEELAQLRTVHQQNLLKLSTKIRQQEMDTAERGIAIIQAQIDALTFKRDHYQELVSSGRNSWETAQSAARHTASIASGAVPAARLIAGILLLLPQLGSPFAMKYGGMETGNSAVAFAEIAKDAVVVADATAGSAGLEATFQRRDEDWAFHRDSIDKELRALEQQLEAAQIRFEMATRAMDVHQATVDQTEEIYEFFLDKFSNLGLYTYLSSALQRMFRDAYNGAYAMAKLAEQAYRFERDDDAPVLSPSYWDAGHNGLLAGELLTTDLQQMERRLLETNYRTLEIDQPFSLQQIAPAALLQLRQTGRCEFWIPELYFDVFYPGQYRRRIKSVRLTIPSVTGPYTNVSATLTLLESKIRTEAKLGDANIVTVPPRRSVSIATSTAQNDAGVFELSFRDERYMPFEGAGAISRWQLSLPGSFRPFDYQTINDVIVSIAYTASSDGLLRDQVEAENAALQGSLLNVLGTRSLARTFSLRQDFSGAFARLLHSPAGTPVPFDITDKYFPSFFPASKLRVTKARLVVRTAAGQAPDTFALSIDGKPQGGFLPDPDMGGLPTRDLGTLFAAKLIGAHTVAVVSAGPLAPDPPLPPGDVSALDAGKLADLLLFLEYRLA